jgi:hypothetical protein
MVVKTVDVLCKTTHRLAFFRATFDRTLIDGGGHEKCEYEIQSVQGN